MAQVKFYPPYSRSSGHHSPPRSLTPSRCCSSL